MKENLKVQFVRHGHVTDIYNDEPKQKTDW